MYESTSAAAQEFRERLGQISGPLFAPFFASPAPLRLGRRHLRAPLVSRSRRHRSTNRESRERCRAWRIRSRGGGRASAPAKVSRRWNPTHSHDFVPLWTGERKWDLVVRSSQAVQVWPNAASPLQ